MSYATVEDVTDLFRAIDTTATGAAVTETKIQKWLDAAHEMIKGKINTLYQPINENTMPLSVLVLAQIEAFKVAGIVDDILNNYAAADKKPEWERRAMTMLMELVPNKDSKGAQPEPTTKLPDALYIGTTVQKGKVKLYPNGTATFKKGEDNW